MGISLKRSFAEFQDLTQTRSRAPSTVSFHDHDSTYGSASTHVQHPRIYIKQDLAIRHEQAKQPAETPFPLLRRTSSLLNLDELRKLQPLTLLTTANLCAMDPTHLPPTPCATASAAPSTPTGSPNKSATESDAGRSMAMVGLLDCPDSEDRLRKRPALREAINQIVGGQRASTMKPASIQAYTKELNKLKRRNEATIAERLMPFLRKHERTVADSEDIGNAPVSDADMERSVEIQPGMEANARRQVLREFELDHLEYNINQDFTKDSVPYPANETELRSYYSIKNPKPDIVYGIQRGAFNQQQQKALLKFEPDLPRGIISPFLIVEWKGFAGKMQLGKDQARRGGAAMVYSRRLAMSQLIGAPISADQRDLATMVFTCTINEVVAHFHVHWAEEAAEGGTEWLMAVVARKLVDDEENIPEIRRILHNIIEWGLSTRLDLIRKQVDLYIEQGMQVSEDNNKKRRRI